MDSSRFASASIPPLLPLRRCERECYPASPVVLTHQESYYHPPQEDMLLSSEDEIVLNIIRKLCHDQSHRSRSNRIHFVCPIKQQQKCEKSKTYGAKE